MLKIQQKHGYEMLGSKHSVHIHTHEKYLEHLYYFSTFCCFLRKQKSIKQQFSRVIMFTDRFVKN